MLNMMKSRSNRISDIYATLLLFPSLEMPVPVWADTSTCVTSGYDYKIVFG